MSRAVLLRKLIKELGPREVGYQCRVSPQTVANWVAGAEPKAKHLIILAKLAGIPVDRRLEELAGLSD